jgi:outer membrane protein TolC
MTSNLRAARIAALVTLMSTGTLGAVTDAGPVAPLLSVDEAVDIAQRNNHLLAGTARVIDEAEERAAALRTRRLPGLHLDATGGRLLNSLDFTIPAGSLGTIPQVGPFPASDATVTAPVNNFVLATASASQPLSQQYRIGLGIEVARLDGEIAREDLRREKHRVATEVRTAYYNISATEAGIAALRDLVRSVEELDLVTSRYLEEGLVLRSDGLDVKARLARERQRLAATENTLASQREHLNQLLGRDVETPFRVTTPSELLPPAARLTLEAARERARVSRAEVRAASLRTTQADTTRRLAISGWIPDVSLVASYTRLAHFDVLPDQVSSVGLFFTWEPFDWGRKRHEAAEREYTTERARETRLETEQEIAVEVGQRWRAVNDAAALLDAMRQETEATSAGLEIDLNRYRENAAILRDVLRTESRHSAARHDFTDALAGYWSAVAELERTIGDEN